MERVRINDERLYIPKLETKRQPSIDYDYDYD
jgi:hypothetical protein